MSKILWRSNSRQLTHIWHVAEIREILGQMFLQGFHMGGKTRVYIKSIIIGISRIHSIPFGRGNVLFQINSLRPLRHKLIKNPMWYQQHNYVSNRKTV